MPSPSWWIAVACALGCASCGRIWFDPLGQLDGGPAGDGGPDATRPDAPEPDAPTPDAGPISCLASWAAGAMTVGPAVRLDSLSTLEEERDPVLSADGLTLIFGRGVMTRRDVFEAARPSLGEPFGPATLRMDLSSPNDESKVTFTEDGLVAVVASDRPGGPSGVHDLWYGTRASETELFGELTLDLVVNLNSTDIDLDPHLSGDGLRLYYAPRPLSTLQRLAVASRADRTAVFDAPVEITELNTSFQMTADPFLPGDERILFFSAQGVIDDRDLYYATRDDPAGRFGDPIPMPVLNTTADDEGDPFVSRDGCELFFARGRPGDFDIYHATITP